jgi:hypothetical protein
MSAPKIGKIGPPEETAPETHIFAETHTVRGAMYDDAAHTVRDLENAGIPRDDISMVASNVDEGLLDRGRAYAPTGIRGCRSNRGLPVEALACSSVWSVKAQVSFDRGR